MSKPIHLRLQTTIPSVEDDWTIDRFSLLAKYLASIESLCTLGGIGWAHFFHSINVNPDESRHVADEIKHDPRRLGEVKSYIRNVARWLSPSN